MADDTIGRRLTELRNGLLRLHKSLLDAERREYDHEVQRIRTTGQFFELVLHDPWFAWLHDLSGLVVLIDEKLDSGEPATAAEADKLLSEARGLLIPDEQGTGFARRYFEAIQRDPDVVLAHREASRLIASLG